MPSPPRKVILGAADLGAPSSCKVADHTLSAIGFANLENPSSQFRDLSWTEGVSTESRGGMTTYERLFYLGTPPALDTSKFAGCALFFPVLDWSAVHHADESGQGNCSSMLSESCVTSMLGQAAIVQTAGLSQKDACSKLLASFQGSIASPCKEFTYGNWSGLAVSGQSMRRPP